MTKNQTTVKIGGYVDVPLNPYQLGENKVDEREFLHRIKSELSANLFTEENLRLITMKPAQRKDCKLNADDTFAYDKNGEPVFDDEKVCNNVVYVEIEVVAPKK